MTELTVVALCKLAAGDFSPDGVLSYTLPTPLPFQSGDVLGVYQPITHLSVVRLYHFNESNAPVIAIFAVEQCTNG